MPGANQVLEPMYRRFEVLAINPKKCGLANVLPIFASTIPHFIAPIGKTALNL